MRTQTWIAITTCLLVAVLKKEMSIEHSLYTILQILSVSLFEKTPVLQALSAPTDTAQEGPFPHQLASFKQHWDSSDQEIGTGEAESSMAYYPRPPLLLARALRRVARVPRRCPLWSPRVTFRHGGYKPKQ